MDFDFERSLSNGEEEDEKFDLMLAPPQNEEERQLAAALAESAADAAAAAAAAADTSAVSAAAAADISISSANLDVSGHSITDEAATRGAGSDEVGSTEQNATWPLSLGVEGAALWLLSSLRQLSEGGAAAAGEDSGHTNDRATLSTRSEMHSARVQISGEPQRLR